MFVSGFSEEVVAVVFLPGSMFLGGDLRSVLGACDIALERRGKKKMPGGDMLWMKSTRGLLTPYRVLCCKRRFLVVVTLMFDLFLGLLLPETVK